MKRKVKLCCVIYLEEKVISVRLDKLDKSRKVEEKLVNGQMKEKLSRTVGKRIKVFGA